MKFFSALAICFLLASLSVPAQDVSQSEMQQVFEEVRTPYKYGLVVAPQVNDKKFDCPTVFRHNGRWFMTYVCYNGVGGNDGRGYETLVATSEDLLHWQTLSKALEFASDTSLWDANQRGGFPALVSSDWGGDYSIGTHKGKYWMTYIGGHGTGYEAVREPLSIGLAWSNDPSAAKLWTPEPRPILSYNDPDAQWWEQMTLYKSTIYKMDSKLLGAPYVMFYNAGGKDFSHPKGERIGIALSKDLRRWRRLPANPVFAHDSDGTITGDAQIVRMNNLWVMFYFSAFNPSREYGAYNTFAASRDLVHWTDWTGEDLIVPSEPYDEMFAHKSCVVKWNGTVYHFYCAVNKAGQRGIALATSSHLGQSEVEFPARAPQGHRGVVDLATDWHITHDGKSFVADIPINLDDYHGATQQMHGNLHGEATFRKSFTLQALEPGKRVFLRLEGVGTYADVSINGHHVGRYDVGRLVATIDVTENVRPDSQNTIEIGVSHPAGITDMPWVCGGCSSEWGFSEGSQPFGIFRPVSLEITDEVRIEPFGVHAWSNTSNDTLFIETEIRNYSRSEVSFNLVTKMNDRGGKQIFRLKKDISLKAGETIVVRQHSRIETPNLWSPQHPYLYTIGSIVKRNGKATESVETPFGFRTISWPLARKDGDRTFRLNGVSTFINGVCEYEHILGQSHAFSKEQVRARVKMVKTLGFNAFRDAHQPHHLLYGTLLDEQGVLWWPQFSAHIWFDTPTFRESFKRHLRQWVRERRNSPSVILWGLQNESTLPADFAAECTQIIRELDPTCGTQRLVTTCNGGEGTDWNVVQNWSGTYGGNVDNYANELSSAAQLLNGEYGAWRSLGNHSSYGYPEQKALELLAKKDSLAWLARDSVCGQFLWPLASHDNPGRRQPDEGYRRADKVGPFNHKGLLTIWDQPVDAFYLYMQRHSTTPFVFRSNDGRILTNCDTVESAMANGVTRLSGRKIVDGRTVCCVFSYLNDPTLFAPEESLLAPRNDRHYAYRINCGGDAYTDSFGNVWMADDSTLCHSWGSDFVGMRHYSASQTANRSLPVSPIFQTSRYGRHRLSYCLPLAPGDYDVDLFFIEPWHGAGFANEVANCSGLRAFDVALNDSVVLKNLDIWAQAHYATPYRRSVRVHNDRDSLTISFPRVLAGQALISGIAVSSPQSIENKGLRRTAKQPSDYWGLLDADTISRMPDSLLPSRDLSVLRIEGRKAVKGKRTIGITWDFTVGVAKVYALRWRYHNAQSPRQLHVTITDQNGVVYVDQDVTFLQSQAKKTKRKMTSITTGSFVNAGTYRVLLSGDGLDDMTFDELTVE